MKPKQLHLIEIFDSRSEQCDWLSDYFIISRFDKIITESNKIGCCRGSDKFRVDNHFFRYQKSKFWQLTWMKVEVMALIFFLFIIISSLSVCAFTNFFWSHIEWSQKWKSNQETGRSPIIWYIKFEHTNFIHYSHFRYIFLFEIIWLSFDFDFCQTGHIFIIIESKMCLSSHFGCIWYYVYTIIDFIDLNQMIEITHWIGAKPGQYSTLFCWLRNRLVKPNWNSIFYTFFSRIKYCWFFTQCWIFDPWLFYNYWLFFCNKDNEIDHIDLDYFLQWRLACVLWQMKFAVIFDIN